jgi:orotate phosphoribosyltransferase
VFVALHAIEASGENAIPHVLAVALANAVSGDVDDNIVQATRVWHTGADPMERLAKRAPFEGAVRAGARYVLVDDVTTMGGTLAELAHYMQARGGMVGGVAVLVNASRTGRLVPDRKVIRQLEGRHGSAIRDILGIEPGALTADEAQYLIGFRTADEIGNRRAKAEQETANRLRAKGVQGLGGQEAG